jgi:hypothetical protein
MLERLRGGDMAKRDVVRLLVRLYGDPRLQEKLARDTEKTMKAARLSKKERELLASGDVKAIGRYLGKAAAKTRVAALSDTLMIGTPDLDRKPRSKPKAKKVAGKKTAKRKRPAKRPKKR